MTHIQPRSPRGAGLLVRLAYRFARRRFGRVPAPLGIMAHHRWVLVGVAGIELSLERATAMDARLKELATLKTATLVGCRFCIDIGAWLARTHGVTEAELRDLPTYETSSVFSPRDKLVLRYAEAMTACPVHVPAEVMAGLQRELDDAALVELTTMIAWENFRARFNHAVGAKEEG